MSAPTIRTTLLSSSSAGSSVVSHGATAGTARPSIATAVIWVGSVTPTNAVDGDVWIDTSS